tara:strand:+ start:28520 stop:28765 length:246 start_codon:yes stop_codon:yes gene_type:complete
MIKTISEGDCMTDVLAEWPGRVAEIHVNVGDAVESNQELLTLESMKMLTPIVAPTSGSVEEIIVSVDEYVDNGQLLLRLST